MKILIALALLVSNAAFADSDFLAEATIKLDSTRSSDDLNRLVASPKAVFQHYQPALDSGSSIVRPVQISGSDTQPIMQVSIKKCVAFFCQTVDLDAVITLKEGKQAGCDRAFLLSADLTRSSQLVRDTYDQLNSNICYKSSSDGRGVMIVKASAQQAAAYSKGLVQGQIFGMLKLQVTPIVAAVNAVLKQ